MSKILVRAEYPEGKLTPSTALAASAASAVKPETTDVLMPSDAPDAIAADAAKTDGVSRVLTVARSENAYVLAAVLAPQLAKVSDGNNHGFAPPYTYGKDPAARDGVDAGYCLNDMQVGQTGKMITPGMYMAADIGLVRDVFEVIPKLEQAI